MTFCFNSSPIFAAWFSLLGSVLLVWPAWRASSIFMIVFNIKKTVKDEQRSVFDEGLEATAEAIKKEAGVWTPANHWLLIAGVGFMVFGGLSSVVTAYCLT